MQIDVLVGYILLSSHNDFKVGIEKMMLKKGVINSTSFNLKSWIQSTYVSDKALTDDSKNDEDQSYLYPLIWRISGQRVLLLSYDRKIVEDFRYKLAELTGVKIEPINIAVDSFVKDTSSDPGEFVLSTVYARVSAYGTCLKSISFYGDDIAEAKFFRDGLDFFNCHTCGIRRIKSGSEILRISNDGSIFFRYSTASKLKEVENVLSYLKKKGYFDENANNISREN